MTSQTFLERTEMPGSSKMMWNKLSGRTETTEATCRVRSNSAHRSAEIENKLV